MSKFEIIVWLPLVAGSLFVGALVFFWREPIPRSAAIGIGALPLIFQIVVILSIHAISADKTFINVPIWWSIQVFSVIISPNYSVALIVGTIALVAQTQDRVCLKSSLGLLLSLIAIHVTGLAWATFILGYEGSI